MPDNHLISFVFWRPQIISRYKMGFFFLFCNKRTLNHEQDNCEERCTFPCFNYSVVFSTPVPIIDFVIRLYKLSWKMIIYKNLLSILLESNFWKRNISLKHTFYWVFVFLFYRPFIIYSYWTSFLVFTCNIPAILLTVFVWKSFHNHLQKSIHVYMCYRTNVWYRLTHHLLGHENSSIYLRCIISNTIAEISHSFSKLGKVFLQLLITWSKVIISVRRAS